MIDESTSQEPTADEDVFPADDTPAVEVDPKSGGTRFKLTDEQGNEIDPSAARKAVVAVAETSLDVAINAVGETAGRVLSRFKNAFESFADKLEGKPEPDLRDTVLQCSEWAGLVIKTDCERYVLGDGTTECANHAGGRFDEEKDDS